MKLLLKLEEFGMFLLGIYFFSLLDYEWWIFPILFFLPDLGMFGYLNGKKTGAWMYNICHHKGLAVIIFVAGIQLTSPDLQLTGRVIFSHAAFDRFMGYGLKYEEGFKITHLGNLGPDERGKQANQENRTFL